MRNQVIDDLVETHMPPRAYAEQWDLQGLYAQVIEKLGIDVPVIEWGNEDGVDDETMRERLEKAADEYMAKKAASFGAENMRNIEKQILLQTIDQKWREHLLTLEHLRSVVGFRGYAQRDPLNEYKNEAFHLFETMLDSLREGVTQNLSQIQPLTDEQRQQLMDQLMAQQQAQSRQLAMAEADTGPEGGAPAQPQVESQAAPASADEPVAGFVEDDPTTWGNPGRNEKCPCGSGKKFKHCHGRLA